MLALKGSGTSPITPWGSSVCDTQELATGRAVLPACSLQRSGGAGTLSGSQDTDSKHRQSCHLPEMPEKAAPCQRWLSWKHAAIRGYLSATFELSEIRAPGSRHPG